MNYNFVLGLFLFGMGLCFPFDLENSMIIDMLRGGFLIGGASLLGEYLESWRKK